MSDKKITQLTALTGANAVAGDQLAIVDVSDTTMSASGTTKKIALSELQAAPLSAGTANGVAFLNASKVLTTGSALVFDGTTLALKNTANLADNYNTVAFSSDFTPSLTVDSNISGQINFYNKSNNGTQQLGVSIQAGATTTSTSPTALIGFLGLYAHFSAAGVIQDTSYLELYANTTSTLQGNAGLELRSGSTASSGKSLFFYTDDGNTEAYRILSTGTSIWKVGGSEQMRLTSTGLGIGTSSPNQKLDIAGSVQVRDTGTLYLNNSDNTNQYYWQNIGASGANNATLILSRTNAGETLRIDASGNLLVGTTSTSTTNGAFALIGSGAINSYLAVGHKNGSNSGSDFLALYYNGTQIGGISQSGTTAVQFNTTSDQRLKENITDADSASTLIDALQVRKFDWKAGGSHQRYGFVAQELVTVAPEAVHQPADSEEMMAVDYSKLVPMLVKEIQDLRKRLAAANI